jgi:hypothetical protein
MMPKSENDFNNFKDTIYDKYNRPGYLIQRGKYYIYQPFDDNENIPMYYRVNYELETDNLTSVKNYVENKYGDVKEEKEVKKKDVVKKKDYDFSATMDYYDKRDENFIVGIISMNTNDFISDNPDIFKIRPPLSKSANKKRGKGIYSLTGAVCATSKDKDTLLKYIKKLTNLINDSDKIKNTLITRENMCEYIMKLLLYLEKYSTSKDDNKITYVILPSDHKKYPFPYNLEDRIKHIIKNITTIIKREFDYKVIKEKNGEYETINNLPNYIIEIKINKYIEENSKELEKLFNNMGKFKKEKNYYNIYLD